MTVLLDDGEGHRCDATCYNAKGSDCDCICHGQNHGKGLAEAARLSGVTLYSVYFRTKNQLVRRFGFVVDPTDEFEEVKSLLRSWGATKVWLDAPGRDVEDEDDAA